jgi:hypothetical protein
MRSRGAGLLTLLSACVLAAVSAWWLFAEPVHSAVLWTIDSRGNHGLQAADIPGLAAMGLALMLGLRGLRMVVRARKPGPPD